MYRQPVDAPPETIPGKAGSPGGQWPKRAGSKGPGRWRDGHPHPARDFPLPWGFFSTLGAGARKVRFPASALYASSRGTPAKTAYKSSTPPEKPHRGQRNTIFLQVDVQVAAFGLVVTAGTGNVNSCSSRQEGQVIPAGESHPACGVFPWFLLSGVIPCYTAACSLAYSQMSLAAAEISAFPVNLLAIQ